MPRRSSKIFAFLIDDTSWRVAVLTRGEIKIHAFNFTEDHSEKDCVSQVVEKLGLPACKGGALLALPSNHCVAVPFVLDRTGRQPSAQSLLYEIEHNIPLNAEELVADFSIRDTSAFGVATEFAKIKSIVAALDTAGITVSAVTPCAFLAFRSQKQKQPQTDQGLWIGDDGRWIDAVRFSGDQIEAWYGCPVSTKCLDDHLAIWKSGWQDSFELIETITTPGLRKRIIKVFPETRSTQDVEDDASRFYEDAADQALRITTRGQTPAIDLCRDPRIGEARRRRLQTVSAVLLAAIMTLIASMGGAAWFRVLELDRARRSVVAEQASLYREAFPGKPVPGALLSRLRSEALTLNAISGQDQSMPQFESALDRLTAGLVLLPRGVRFRLLEMQLNPQSMRLEGQATNHRAPELLANALRKQEHFSISAPKTQALRSGGVAFTIHGSPFELVTD